MRRRPPRSSRTDTLFPYTTLFRSDRLHRAVGVAILPDQAGFDRVLPRDVDDGDRAGEHAPVFVDRDDFMLAQPLAARHAAHVGVDHLDRIDVGIGLEEGLSLRRGRDDARRLRQIGRASWRASGWQYV